MDISPLLDLLCAKVATMLKGVERKERGKGEGKGRGRAREGGEEGRGKGVEKEGKERERERAGRKEREEERKMEGRKGKRRKREGPFYDVHMVGKTAAEIRTILCIRNDFTPEEEAAARAELMCHGRRT
jgi:hypothetical protein